MKPSSICWRGRNHFTFFLQRNWWQTTAQFSVLCLHTLWKPKQRNHYSLPTILNLTPPPLFSRVTRFNNGGWKEGLNLRSLLPFWWTRSFPTRCAERAVFITAGELLQPLCGELTVKPLMCAIFTRAGQNAHSRKSKNNFFDLWKRIGGRNGMWGK